MRCFLGYNNAPQLLLGGAARRGAACRCRRATSDGAMRARCGDAASCCSSCRWRRTAPIRRFGRRRTNAAGVAPRTQKYCACVHYLLPPSPRNRLNDVLHSVGRSPHCAVLARFCPPREVRRRWRRLRPRDQRRWPAPASREERTGRESRHGRRLLPPASVLPRRHQSGRAVSGPGSLRVCGHQMTDRPRRAVCGARNLPVTSTRSSSRPGPSNSSVDSTVRRLKATG